MPLFSVVTVCFNAVEDLVLTNESVGRQKCRDFEHVIIDGASTDGTSLYLSGLSRINRHIVSEPDSGIYDAMMKGVSLCSGSYVIFMNAGDQFADDFVLERVREYAIDSGTDFIYGGRIKIEENGDVIPQLAGNPEGLLFEETIYHQSLFTRTELLRHRPYNFEHYSLAADYEYLLDAKFRRQCSFFKVDFHISKFRAGGRSRQQHVKANIEAMHAAIRFLPSPESWLENKFVVGFVMNNFPRILNQELCFGAAGEEKLFYDESNQKLVFFADKSDPYMGSIASKLNRALSGIVQKRNRRQPTSNASEEGGSSPDVTVVTINLNNLDGLKRTVASVKNQDLPGVQYVVIDGLSTDGSQEFIKSSRHLISDAVIERDGGIYDAMNKGANLAKGRYVLFLNSGDTFATSSALSVLFGEAVIKGADIVYGHRIYKNGSGDKVVQHARDVSTIFSRMPCGHQSMLYRTEHLRENLFNTTYAFAGDYEHLLRVYTAGAKILLVNHVVCIFESGGRSESGLLPYIETVHAFLRYKPDGSDLRGNVYLRGLENNISGMF